MDLNNIVVNTKQDIQDFLNKNSNWVVVIRWATATWKTWLSVKLADFFDVNVISADSRQIYKYMDIWTDKISMEIRNKIPHYQIDIVEPSEIYTAWSWKIDTEKYVDEIHRNGKIPFVVGGTGLYVDTIYKNFTMPCVLPDYEFRQTLEDQEASNPGSLHIKLAQIDPEQALIIHPKSTRHLIRAIEIFEKTWKTKSELASQLPVRWPMLMIGLWREKEDTNIRINKRIKEMFEIWLVDEVKMLMDKGYGIDMPAMLWIWYKEIVWYLKWEYDLERSEELLKRNTHQYAKRQRTWFRRYIAESKSCPKDNVEYKLYMLD